MKRLCEAGWVLGFRLQGRLGWAPFGHHLVVTGRTTRIGSYACNESALYVHTPTLNST